MMEKCKNNKKFQKFNLRKSQYKNQKKRKKLIKTGRKHMNLSTIKIIYKFNKDKAKIQEVDPKARRVGVGRKIAEVAKKLKIIAPETRRNLIQKYYWG